MIDLVRTNVHMKSFLSLLSVWVPNSKCLQTIWNPNCPFRSQTPFSDLKHHSLTHMPFSGLETPFSDSNSTLWLKPHYLTQTPLSEIDVKYECTVGGCQGVVRPPDSPRGHGVSNPMVTFNPRGFDNACYHLEKFTHFSQNFRIHRKYGPNATVLLLSKFQVEMTESTGLMKLCYSW